MKQLMLPFVAMLIGISAANAQTAKDVFNPEAPLTYLGIDFTKARIIGDAGANTDDIVARQYATINQKVINEYKKYDIAGAFNRKKAGTDIGPVNKRNAKIDPDGIKSDDSDDYQAVKAEDITALVKGFNFDGKTGLGLLFVMEGYNKTEKRISMYVTLVDMKAKKVLFTERMEGALGMGFTYANVYLTGIKKVIDEIDKRKFREWKSAYGG